ncbi:MAG: sigma-70 family RNA polymerase sigma factor [Elusimicrobia bacterium]|nr:sigma-70 family RNA polymerase sigma factor [Elusimicrobiota bacterium]
MGAVLVSPTDAVQDFAAFYDEWFDRVYNYARHRTGSATSADEIVSDVFTRALDSWHRFDPLEGDLRSWLFSIAFRSVADHYRSEKRRGWLTLDALFGARDAATPPGRRLEEADETGRLLAALACLDEQQREVVSLRFYGGLTNRAIGKLLDLSESNVGVILFRAVRRLRQALAGEEVGRG